MTTIRKLLVANRGEIACRIIRSCHALGIEAIAVYSEADRDALHVELADDAVEVGPPSPAESYLNRDAIIEAADSTRADAVHPGYGFLSENADFARAVTDAGLVWVGPAPSTIEDMGDKERARDIAQAAGVHILPGSPRFSIEDTVGLEAIADSIGFPMLVKAASGGGGIGMQRVDKPDRLVERVEATQSLAAKIFGDSSVYLERYVTKARHIEVQVFGFGDGSGVHLYDRDCSVQRRFQKIVEEAPAPCIPETVKAELFRAALALVHHQRYRGAGTVEFIYDVERGEAYFLEMNTRIQVEHPVTEMVTGVDLIAWQIQQAMGALPPIAQEEISLSGHAIESRVYAERPEKNFLPSPGVITGLNWPSSDPALRIDTGVRAGDRVTHFYDPMIAKLIAHGDDRSQAIARLSRHIDDLNIEGLSTNIQFLSQVLADAEFGIGGVSIEFVMSVLGRGAKPV